MRYAQEFKGQRLHLVAEQDRNLTGREVAFRSLCGKEPTGRGDWRMTCNLSLGVACKNCLRVFNARQLEEAAK